ncbi:MAG: PKD domain-containing protein [Flavobacteriales bacterium]|nr:PKD domain-containing protein [Flavobacteriales bacterium]
MKRINLFLGVVSALLLSNVSLAQLSGGNAYMIGDFVEIGVDANGMEGTDDYTPSNSRGGGCASSYFGFVANPQMDGWTDYDGDFFTPGTPENGFGIDVDGTEYSNNAAPCFGPDYEITTTPGSLEWMETDDCIIVDWEGTAGGIGIHVQYKLVKSETFYTMNITMWNESAGLVDELYYYRNFDPDNNQTIGGGFPTNNTIISQPDGICDRAIVSAEQTTPWESFVGLGSIDPNARVSYGGFSNRDGSEIWNGIGFTSAEGSTGTGDVAISIAYKVEDFAEGDTTEFSFVVILDESQVDNAVASLYYFEYEGGFGGVIDDCNPVVDTAITCAGYPVTISVDGPDAASYTWEWSPPTDLSTTTGPTTEASPFETTTYTVTGTPTSGCLEGEVSKDIVVALTGGPQASYDDPGPQCGAFDITTLVWEDLAGIPGTISNFYTDVPDSLDDPDGIFTGPLMTSDDVVYLMIGDPATGCFSVVEVIIDFSGELEAGNDSLMVVCSTDGLVDVSDLVSPWANPLGVWDEVTSSGQFDAATSTFDPSGLPGGDYVFEYTIVGAPPCPDDVALLTVTVNPTPIADFEYTFGSGGPSSADGATQGCLESEIFYLDESTILTPGTIDTWNWSFGDGGNSTDPAPSHNYTSPGTYTINLTVTSDAGCTSTYSMDITMYDNPALDIISNDPSCFGYTDGSVSVNTSGGSGSYTIEWTNEDDEIINIGGSDAANSLGEGWYYVNVDDGTGCSGESSVFLDAPDDIEIEYDLIHVDCHGDASGLIAITDLQNVIGTANTITYNWAPVSPCGTGLQADTACSLAAGDYTLTINDANGCSKLFEFTVEEPPALEFVEIGVEPALCRLYDYQSGSGKVFAAAGGGTPDYTYEWENLGTGATTDATTWGGLNPGDYQITVTDNNGCILTQEIALDSVNPAATFTMSSPQMETSVPFAGTAPMTVYFTNTSTDFSLLEDPFSDTSGWWNFTAPDGNEVYYEGTEGYNTVFDWTYSEQGTYLACLKIQNKNGCIDSTCQEILVYEPIAFTPVNVFTPDGDGVNDVFTFANFAKSVVEFNCVIVDRWGITKYEMTSIDDEWDGTDRSGSKCRDGVYFYHYTVTTQNGTQFAGQGNVQILNSNP